MYDRKVRMYDRKVRIGARLANGEVVYLGQCVLHQLGFSALAGKFREKRKCARSYSEGARLAGVAHGGIWKEDGQGVLGGLWLKQNSTGRGSSGGLRSMCPSHLSWAIPQCHQKIDEN